MTEQGAILPNDPNHHPNQPAGRWGEGVDFSGKIPENLLFSSVVPKPLNSTDLTSIAPLKRISSSALVKQTCPAHSLSTHLN
jgi:hypothetical protein